MTVLHYYKRINTVHISLDKYPNHSVYAVPLQCARPAEWCRALIGDHNWRKVDGQHSLRFSLSGYNSYCQFSFADLRHKMLFHIAWGHLGIYDSVALLEAAITARGLHGPDIVDFSQAWANCSSFSSYPTMGE